MVLQLYMADFISLRHSTTGSRKNRVCSSLIYLSRIQGDHAQYYRTALRYLGCIDLATLTSEVKHQHAFFLGLAALLGEGVYNLGELLAHPVLETLKSTETGWLVELLYAFNSGDINKYEQMKPHWGAIADLAAQELFLRQKISLLCLMEMTFKRPSHNRQLTFNEIAKETKLPVNEVEVLVMKALSQGLVKGAIDQVSFAFKQFRIELHMRSSGESFFRLQVL